jgi:hypothetical protein
MDRSDALMGWTRIVDAGWFRCSRAALAAVRRAGMEVGVAFGGLRRREEKKSGAAAPQSRTLRDGCGGSAVQRPSKEQAMRSRLRW